MNHPSRAAVVEFDEANEGHLARHAVTPDELMQVLDNEPLWARNKNGRTAQWRVIGRTYGGRPIVAAVLFDEARDVLRPITARTCEPAEVARWGI